MVRTGVLIAISFFQMFAFSSFEVWSQEKATTGVPLLQLQEEIKGVQRVVPADRAGEDFVGKLTIKYHEDDEETHHCTGMFVDKHVVVTAAHCVQANGSSTMYKIVEFMRAKDSKKYYAAPDCVKVPEKWAEVTEKYLRVHFDYAFFRTTEDLSDSPAGISTVPNPYGKDVTIWGYPGANPLTAIEGSVELDVVHPTVDSYKTDQITFTIGTSGGPWVNKNNKKVMTVTSSFVKVLNDPLHIRIYGPKFENDADTMDDAADLLTAAKDCAYAE